MKILIANFFAAALAVAAACGEAPAANAASGAEIERDANDTLHSFVRQIGGARELANKAVGILVFPSVIKAGFGLGGEYGEGRLLEMLNTVPGESAAETQRFIMQSVDAFVGATRQHDDITCLILRAV